MAVGDYTNFEIYEDEFYGQLNETLQQNSAVFNAASANTIVLETDPSVGNFQKEAFFQSIGSGLVSRRDIGSTSSQTPDSLSSDEFNRPKLARGYFVSQTYNSLKRIGVSESEFSLRIGEQVAKAMQVDYLNTILLCGVTAMLTESDVVEDQSGAASNTLEISYLISALARFGDAAEDIAAWAMHSKAFYDLMGEQATNITDRLAGATIYEGTVGTLGKPVVVTDSAELVNTDGITSGTDSYYTVGLTPMALGVVQDGQPTQSNGVNRGNENLEWEIQGEHDFTTMVKGYDYTDTTVNPDDSALGTAGNWNNVMADVKSTAGVIIEHA